MENGSNEPSLNQTAYELESEKKGFCAILRDGETKNIYSNNVGEFCPFIENASISWVDYVVEDFDREAFDVASIFGFSETFLKHLMKNTKSGYEDFGNELGIVLPAITVSGFEVKLAPLMILIRESIIVTIHSIEIKRFSRMRRYAETFMHKLPEKMEQKDRITSLLIRIIDENNARNFDHLRDIEEYGDKLSEELADPKTSRNKVSKEIHKMKHALIIYLSGLWATVDELNALRYGDAELITDSQKLLNKISRLLGEVNSQIGLAEHLSEVLASGLEVLQSIYNNQLQILNNRLALLVAYLTIIGTALLVPNTIATIASNPVFQLTPKDSFWYISLLFLSTIIATIISWLIVKKMGLLPKSPE